MSTAQSARRTPVLILFRLRFLEQTDIPGDRPDEVAGILECGAARRVVEDAPGIHAATLCRSASRTRASASAP